MKGQFFIISTVIMISAMIMIMNYLYDYGKVDLTKIEKTQELNYIGDIQNNLRTTLKTSCQLSTSPALVGRELNLTETFLKNKLLERGISLNIEHNSISCPNANFHFILKSNEFNIENYFSV